MRARPQNIGPKRHSDRQAEQDPVKVSTATQRGVKCKAGERPERQLDDIVIELDGREIEVLHSVDDKNRKERAEGPHQRQSRRKDETKLVMVATWASM